LPRSGGGFTERAAFDYSEANFAALLGRSARLIRQERVPSTGRTLFWFDRS
jgi:hypothetical protein